MKDKEIKEILFAGFGGQGIVLSGYILGKALSLYDKKRASMTQSYGPEARGGACSSGLVISDNENEDVDYPKVRFPDCLVVLSQEAYTTHLPKLKSDGILIYDSDLVTLNPPPPHSIDVVGIPFTRLAEEKIGKSIVANVVMLGALLKITNITSKEALVEAIKTTVRKDFIDMNLKALEVGWEAVENV